MRHILMVIVISLVGLYPAIAQAMPEENQPTREKPASSAFEGLKRTGSGRIDQVIDALTVTMKDGKIVRLSGIDVPGMGQAQGDSALKAYHILKTLLPEGTEVALYQTRQPKTGRTNRMGQQLAQLHIEKNNIWIQGTMLTMGLARAMPDESLSSIAAQLLDLENTARAQGMGLWEGISDHRVLTPDELTDKTGTMQVVEGTVLSAANMRNTLYLNFGKDWRTDFTIRIEPAIRKALTKAGIDPLSLSGKKVRVRGYVESYNGPMITLENIYHLELITALSPQEKTSDAIQYP